MARLIDADAIIDFIDMGHFRNPLETCFSERDVVDMIESAPTVDAVPVVRCGKCEHFRPYEGEEHKGDCAELVGLDSCVYEDDFCSYGERKDGDGNDWKEKDGG